MAAGSHILDTGPLVALLDRSDRDHAWSRRAISQLKPPLFTCEAVLSEALYLLQGDPAAPSKIEALLARGLLGVKPVGAEHGSKVLALMQGYRNVPMSFAGACLVRIAELLSDPVVITLDSDFRIYRRHGRQPIRLLSPRR